MKTYPILTCTLLALISGFLGGYIGGQITTILHSQKCQNQAWGLQQMCRISIIPIAWQGSTTGIWTGTILGAFAGGLIIRENRY